MSKLAWIAPLTTPTGTKTIQLVVPDQFELEAAIRGALLPLFFTDNWQAQTGGISIDDTIDFLNSSVYPSLVNWVECSGDTKMVGEVFAYAGSGVPAGCLLCDGSEYAQSAYPALYNAIGDTWGSAGAGNFCVPLISARSIVSTGQISGGTLREAGDLGGAESRVITASNLPEHTHTVPASSQNIIAGVGNQIAVMRAGGTVNTGGAGFGTAMNIMPPFIVMPYYIVAE